MDLAEFTAPIGRKICAGLPLDTRAQSPVRLSIENPAAEVSYPCFIGPAALEEGEAIVTGGTQFRGFPPNLYT